MSRKYHLLILLLLLPALGWSQAGARPPVTSPSDLIDIFNAVMGHWLSVSDSYATEIFWVLASLDIAWFGIQLWRQSRNDLSSAMTETTYKLLIIGIALSLLVNGATWMPMIIAAFEQIGKEGASVPKLSPSLILTTGLDIAGSLLAAAFRIGSLVDPVGGLGLLTAAFLIFLSFVALTFQFVMAKVDVFLTLGLGHVFLAFGGSRWTMPYLERYFALSFSSGVRLMVTYALIGGGWSLTNTWISTAQSVALSPASIESSWALAAGALLFSLICWFSPRMVSSLLSGSPAFSGGEVLSFLSPMISAGVSAGLITAGFASGGATAVVGAATGGAGSTASAAGGTVSNGAAAPSAASTPASTPPNTGGGGGSRASGAATAGLQLASVGARTLQSMPHGGSHSAPPHFDGFRH